ncbi:MAG TPA: N-6 DNA methylase [Marinilabiliaceae bacterium]|jgi:type I restriction enzyme M protein|nr:MAG: putative type I restriction enzymeP M protein [Bacteroidetes bacterium ADurb.Bin174]HLW07931.1 N-6 DNA methylase [Marinilabiliaceae bacterium]
MAKTKKTKSVKQETPAQRLSGIIKSCRQIMRKDKGMNGDADRLPMLTWIMFLKFLDDNEQMQEVNAQLEGKKYKPAIESPYRWRDWAKDTNLTGDDLLNFISNEKVTLSDGKERTGLFYYLRSLQSESGTERKDVIATAFKGISNRMINGYLLRDVVNKIDGIHFTNNEEINTLSHLYESILKEMRDASGDAGEFYTPRPVVRFMVEMLAPKIGETVLDPASGTGGFLVEAFDYLKKQAKTVEQRQTLQRNSIVGGEPKSLPFLLCQMNLLLHGLEYPNIDSGNSLRFPLKDIGDSERVDVILTNPPFGGEEERGILNNFPNDKRTAETALLFLQLIMRKLKRKKPNSDGGRAAVVVPNSTLAGNGITGRILKQLISDFNLHTVVRLGEGVFAPYTDIPSNLIFFDTTKKTDTVWFYEVPIPKGKKKYSKSKPLKSDELEKVKKWWNKREESENSWSVKVAELLQSEDEKIDLDLRNPNKVDPYENLDANLLITKVREAITQNLALITQIQNEISNSLTVKTVSLSTAIEESTDSVEVNPTVMYNFAGVYGFGKGLFKREPLSGSNTSYKSFHRLHKDEIVISKVKGWEGAIALITEEFDGLYLSSQYPTFKAKEGVNIKYIAEYCKHPRVWQELLDKSKGIGARRNSISVDTFLSLKIPLPELEEQDKIVDALEKLSELKRKQSELNKSLELLTPAILETAFNSKPVEEVEV